MAMDYIFVFFTTRFFQAFLWCIVALDIDLKTEIRTANISGMPNGSPLLDIEGIYADHNLSFKSPDPYYYHLIGIFIWNYIIVWELFLFDRNIWNHITMYRLIE